MSCACFTVTFEKLTEPFSIGVERLSAPFSVRWKRFCETLVDLVPFNAADGRFLTNEGYTILVKI